MKTHSSGSPSRCSHKKQKTVHMNNVVEFRSFMALPISVRADILNYVGDNNKQEELRELMVISKGMHEVCRQPGIVWELKNMFLLNPLKNIEDGGSVRNFIRKVNQYQLDDDFNIPRYRHLKVNHIDKFDSIGGHRKSIIEREIADNNIRMDGIESLDLRLPFQTPSVENMFSLPYILSHILPNLREFDATNLNVRRGYRILNEFSTKCPRLEKITWHNIAHYVRFEADGIEMQSSYALKELSMDNSTFCCSSGFMDRFSNLNNHLDTYLFCKCGSKVLERISIRNATWGMQKIGIPQNALIKLVRNAPSTLTWFRSDLTPENIDLLEKEFPGIEFQN
mmetsp:Transcript_29834/g.32077  ORF Transcript_29834/g.32077 Transcript_29834/m.32077 type:complete len:338 (+) Transcript_29834:173-1186(+)